MKTWGVVIEDVNSGAVHLDVVTDYSTNGILMALRRFGSDRGWPGVIQTDPGSQLESASGKLENWWSSFGDPLKAFASTKNFEWKVSPADFPWRQGKAKGKPPTSSCKRSSRKLPAFVMSALLVCRDQEQMVVSMCLHPTVSC